MKRLTAFLVAALLAPLASAAIEVIIPETWTLYRGTTIVQPRVAYESKAACETAALLDLQHRCIGAETFVRRADAPLPAPTPTPTPAPPAGSYDVSARIAAFHARLAEARPGATFPVALPAAPTITSRRTVSTATEMQAAMGVAGVEVTFAGSGFEGTLRPRADQRWIFPAGFTLTGPGGGVAISVDQTQRVALVGTGGRVVGAFQARQVADLLVQGMEVRAGSGQYANLNSVDQSQRVLIAGSYLSAPGYALIYSDNADMVVANSEIHSAGAYATTRGARNQRVLLMDSRIVTMGNQQQVRAHAGSRQVAAFGLQIEGGTGAYFGSAGDGCPSVTDLVMLDSAYYGQGDTVFTDGCAGVGTVVGMRGFSPWGSGSQIGVNMPAGSVVRDNPRLPAQVAPAWSRR